MDRLGLEPAVLHGDISWTRTAQVRSVANRGDMPLSQPGAGELEDSLDVNGVCWRLAKDAAYSEPRPVILVGCGLWTVSNETTETTEPLSRLHHSPYQSLRPTTPINKQRLYSLVEVLEALMELLAAHRTESSLVFAVRWNVPWYIFG